MRLLPMLAACLVAASPLHAELMPRNIAVSGQGKVMAKPDKADILLSVHSEAKALSAAKKQSDEQLKALAAIVEAQGIDAKHVTTLNSSVQPRYRYIQQENKQVLDGYTVDHQIAIELRDTDKLGPLVEALIAKQFDRIQSVRYGVQDEEGLKRKALALAAQDAREKAQLLAESQKESIDRLYSLNETGAHYNPPPMPMLRAFKGGAEAAMAHDAAAAPPGGELEVTAGVQAVFTLKP